MAAHKGRTLFVVSEFFELFHFDLVTNVWNQLSSKNIMSDHERQGKYKLAKGIKQIKQEVTSLRDVRRPTQCLKTRKGSSLVLCDKTLYLIGGEDENSRNCNLFISCYDLPKKLDWSKERLLWLACFKNNVAIDDKCFLSQCPPMVIYKIISYVNSDIFML